MTDSDPELGHAADEYESLLRVESLESLLEEIEDSQDSGPTDAVHRRLEQEGVTSPNDLRELIARLHSQLDSD